ncbi:MAG: M16 family metallopeptidase [Pyrinomonadaceae bacterium]
MKRVCYAFMFLLTTFIAGNVMAQKNEELPKLKYEEFTLKNGLRVVLHQDKSTPIVAVNVWYHVGSKNEVPGKTGFAHLFEHMMFQGSENYNDEYFGPLQKAGANINGSTNSDRTNYFEVVPSNFLELALFMESDRMGNLLPAMTMEKLNNQRDVVKNERRQSYDNRPYGTAYEKISELIYPANHPYHWTTIGSLEDLSNASMDDVKAFFRKYYAPNNASLVIAGDFDPKIAKQYVKKYFEPIPRGVKIDRPNPAKPKINGEIRKTFEDAVTLERRYIVWHTSPARSADEPALDILASILSSGRGSRLQKKLVYDNPVVQNVFASNSTRELDGNFMVVATARPKQSVDEIEKTILAEIEQIKNTPPSDEEVKRAKMAYESGFVFGLQTVLGKADQMNGNLVYQNNPDTFVSELSKYRAVTPQDVSRVAKQYLDGNRLVMSFVPGKNQGAPTNNLSNRPTSVSDGSEDAAVADKKKDKVDYSKNLPKPGADPALKIPKIEKAKLSNGLDVWFVPQKELPIVSMSLIIKTGGDVNPKGKEGLSDYTSNMLDKGTTTRSALDIANAAQDLGISLRTSSGWDASSVTLDTLTKDLDESLSIYSDVVLNPSFPEDELTTVKRRAMLGFKQMKESPTAIASSVYGKVLYGEDHPYGRPLDGDEQSVSALKRDDLVAFYNEYYRPNNSILIVVGDTDKNSLMPKLEKAFGAWKAAEVPASTVVETKPFDKPGIYLVDKPGAAQSELRIGQVGIAQDSPDEFPVLVMNQILGGQFAARVNMNLREDKGYTYGARTSFSERRGAGPFTASAGVQTAVTKESVIEFLKELNGIRGAIPISQDELDYAKQSLIRGFPRSVETNRQISGRLLDLAVYGLPDNYFDNYTANIAKVTLADVNRVANQYITPDKMAILVVGDRKTIEPGLRSIKGWGDKITILDADGNPVRE